MASVYDPIRAHLATQPKTVKSVPLTFAALEKLLGRKLPKSALNRLEWWGNEVSSDSTHTQAKFGWMAAGWKAEPNLTAKTVTFSR